MLSPRWLAGGLVATVVAGALLAQKQDDYDVRLVMPSAAQLSEQTPVWIGGRKVGQVTDLGVKDGKALVTISIDDDAAPLHTGTTTRVDWVSAVGERILTVEPGPASNPAIPEGAYVEAASRQVEVDQVLAALDTKTRERVSSLIGRLQATVDGREGQLNDTIQQASGTVDALGDVLRAVGADGPSIRAIVRDLSSLLDASAEKRSQIAASVANLSKVAASVAGEQEAISAMLKQLPSTFDTANTTLSKVPSASEQTVGLLDDLQPSTRRLRSVSKNLAPVLTDLRPTVAELRPLLSAADQLLGRTPALLDSSHQVLPGLDGMLADLAPAVAFLRPYTPDGVGGLMNWGQAFAPYDGAGHTWAGLLAPGTNALNESLVPLPTARQKPEPYPGQAEGQPWTDATGSRVQ
ncbi:MlaD family protein [Nocardioides daeguensis]|uniref:Mce/MlaD domain-containing protein n=1 Tax=Nocardioides daeguensis TaxID=908359 RepID=A0ABP6UZ99_9ACTN|nr:MlaD family protein [Nocardioides daeguensis]MBV6728789.1 MCE family protein [Nocardioides daeguensis]MCR1773601.1 MCE family protein [Nocardioides daeguensis]